MNLGHSTGFKWWQLTRLLSISQFTCRSFRFVNSPSLPSSYRPHGLVQIFNLANNERDWYGKACSFFVGSCYSTSCLSLFSYVPLFYERHRGQNLSTRECSSAETNLHITVHQANVLMLFIHVKVGDDCTLFLLPTSAEPKSTRPLYTMPPTVQGMGKMQLL